MSVESFDPRSTASPPDRALVEAFCQAAQTVKADDERVAFSDFGLSEEQVKAGAVLATNAEWVDWVSEQPDFTIRRLVQLFTLGEMQCPGWTAGEKSPVPQLVRLLKSRGAFTPDLSKWVKRNTTNRFLPHGNLMDRL